MPELHELSIASNLIQALRDAMEQHPGTLGVSSFEVRIGKASFVSREQLGFCLEILCKEDGPLKDARVAFSEEDVEIRCSGCGRIGPMDMASDPSFHYALPIFACPDCGSSVEITKGRSISLTNVTLLMEGE